MDIDTIRAFVLHGVKSTQVPKKASTAFLPFNLIFFAISIIFYRPVYFQILIVVFAGANVITALVFRSRWSVFTALLSQATTMIFLVLALECLIISLSHFGGIFVWYKYLITLGLKVLLLVISFFIVKLNAKRFDKSKNPHDPRASGILAGGVSSLAFIVAMITYESIFANSSDGVVYTVITILLHTAIFLLPYFIVLAYYRAYLIKKHNLNFDDEDIDIY